MRLDLRSVHTISITLFLLFSGLLGVVLYANYRLQALNIAQIQSTQMLLSWKLNENMTRELFITYNLPQALDRWSQATQRFGVDFNDFMNSSVVRNESKGNDTFSNAIDHAQIYWEVVLPRFSIANERLREFLKIDKHLIPTGNLLVTFGELHKQEGDYSPALLDVLEKLRACHSFSDNTFSRALNRVNSELTIFIKRQTWRVQFSGILLLILILTAASLFTIYRIAEINRSKNASMKHAEEMFKEVQERRQAEVKLLSERNKLDSVMNVMGEGLYIVDSEFRVVYQNELLEQRHKDLVGSTCYQEYYGLDEPCTFCRVSKAIERNRIESEEAAFEEQSTYEYVFSPFLDMDGSIKVVVLLRDITEKKTFQAETMRAGHLASIGELAAGVAHEINNPINGIINYAERIESFCIKNEIKSHIPQRIIAEGERIADIVSSLLSFARVGERLHKQVDLEALLNKTLSLVRRHLEKEGICLKVHIESSLPKVSIRDREIQQVFLNLLSNARYALNQKYIRTDENKIIEINISTIMFDVRNYVRITFRDQGTGMPATLIDRICNPFFTTKPAGEGTGLGLSISHGIVVQHDGRLTFRSKAGQYTQATIDLPVDKNVQKLQG